MRNDYFTLCEIARVVRADTQRMKRIFHMFEDFPVKRVGSQYVIPKDQFFTWWDRHKNDNALRFRFDAQSIEKSRDYYVRVRLEKRIRRLPRRAEQR